MSRRTWFGWTLTIALASSALAATESRKAPAPADPDSGIELLGRRAPSWSFTRWVRAPVGSLEDLRGKVVLVRWWTDNCRYCRATLPVLERLQKRYRDRGLVVVGVYHPKPPRDITDAQVLGFARKLGFSGPVALDRDWTTLERYWLGGHPDRNWTSVSFLIDREGRLRWVHGGGEYHPSDDPLHARCAVQYQELSDVLSAALATPAPAP